MNKILLLFALAFPALASAQAQADTLKNAAALPEPLVPAKRLDEHDLVPIVEKNEKIQIVSGSRFPTAAGDLPFSVYVITKEEIRQNAYETLVDALKMAPGIRVSQPGSAVEGETFSMRGLLGNSYAKILINDVPIKPSFVAGMPIGAQLPIREAERIEVIYGAGAALYGSDASAGVINIITRQSEKPVFMQADLSVGQGLYSSVNVMFGGKMGRDKNILRYFVYGSNVLLEKRNIFYDLDYNYNPKNYPGLTNGDTSFALLPNYPSQDPEAPLLNNTPHLSRKFGAIINYKRLTISLESMYRRDHSALGLNPVAVSYHNSLSYTGEGITRVNVNLFKQKEKHNRKTDFSYLRYRLDDRSSTYFVRSQLVNELEKVSIAEAKMSGLANQDSVQGALFDKYYGRYFNEVRYQFGHSDEVRLEHLRNYRILKRLTLTLGANGKLAGGVPYTNYLLQPAEGPSFDFDEVSDSATFSVKREVKFLAESNLLGQVFYNGKKFNIVAGANYAAYSAIDDDDLATPPQNFTKFSPQLAGIYHITPNANVRTSWGKAFRIPNEFYKSNTYLIQSNEVPRLSRQYLYINAENTTSWEVGARIKSKKRVAIDATWFLNETKNLIGYNSLGFFNTSEDSLRYFGISGYNTLNNSSNRYTGGQVVLAYEATNSGVRWFDGQWNYSWIRSKQQVETIDATFAPPVIKGHMHQFRFNFYPSPKTTFVFDLVRVKGLGRTSGANPKDKFSTLDVVARYALSDRFDVYVKVVNFFRKEYAGIPATRTPDDLIYNPQTGRFLRLGMNYNLE